MGLHRTNMEMLSEERRKKSRIIAVMNNKGGCGKTTTAMALGMYLARTGQNVLLWDQDPQCNLTQRIGIPDDTHTGMRLGRIFQGLTKLPEQNMSLIVEFPYLQRIPGTTEPSGKIGIIIGDRDAEIDAQGMTKKLRMKSVAFTFLGHWDIEKYFRDTVNEYRAFFDWVILDTAPALEGNQLNVLALAAAENLIYPIDGIEAALGVRAILNWMTTATENRDPKPNALFAMTRFEPDTKKATWGETDGSVNSVHHVLRKHFPGYVCDAGVREKKSLKPWTPGFGGRNELTDLSAEIVERIRQGNEQNLFDYVLSNETLKGYEEDLAKIAQLIQRRAPRFKKPRYIA